MAPQVLQINPQQILDVLAAQLKRLLNDRMPTCRAEVLQRGAGTGQFWVDRRASKKGPSADEPH